MSILTDPIRQEVSGEHAKYAEQEDGICENVRENFRKKLPKNFLSAAPSDHADFDSVLHPCHLCADRGECKSRNGICFLFFVRLRIDSYGYRDCAFHKAAEADADIRQIRNSVE